MHRCLGQWCCLLWRLRLALWFPLLQGFKGNDGEWIELNNGCMCCSTKSDFVQALEGLLHSGKSFDYILIETTGERATPSCGAGRTRVRAPELSSSFAKGVIAMRSLTVCSLDQRSCKLCWLWEGGR